MGNVGVLLNTSNKEFFEYVAKENSKAFTYDPRYIIFGNSELKIKTNDKKKIVFSNFGITNSFYETKSKKVVDFLGNILEGETERETEFETFEMFSLTFL